jgi:hypothetical protein
MFSADNYVKAFIDGNWLSMGIALIILKSVSKQFGSNLLLKFYMVFNSALEFIRPSTRDTQDKLDDEKK